MISAQEAYEELRDSVSAQFGEIEDEFEENKAVYITLFLKKGVLSFKEILDEYSSILSFMFSFGNIELIQKWLDQKLLTNSDIEYLLNMLVETNAINSRLGGKCALLFAVFERFEKNSSFQFSAEALKNIVEILKKDYFGDSERQRVLFQCQSLMKALLKNYVVDEQLEEIFSKLIKEESKKTFHSYYTNLDNEILESLKLNKYMRYALSQFSLTQTEQSELFEFLRTQEKAQKSLKFLMNNQLENTFDNFDALMTYLKKSEKKTTLNI